MIVEIRVYQTRLGLREQFLAIFNRLSIPEHLRLGIAITEPLLVVDEPDTFVFLRGFGDVESRDQSKNAFYEGAMWKQQLEPQLMPMLVRYEVTVVDDVQGLFNEAFGPPRVKKGELV
jgi:hypothetical protein